MNATTNQSTISPRRARELAAARVRLERERRWVAEHGQSLAGYIERYGAADDPNRSGDGGPAIYEADMAALKRAEDGVLRLGGRA